MPVDLRDAVGVAEDRRPSLIDELVAVERAHRRAGDAVALRVVLAAVARAAEAGRGSVGDQRDVAVVGLDLLLVVLEERAVGLHRAAEVRAAVGDDREARHAVEQAVVADVRGAARDLALGRVAHEGATTNLPSGKSVDRAEVDLVGLLLEERRAASRSRRAGSVTIAPITAPRPSVAPSRNCCAGSARRAPARASAGRWRRSRRVARARRRPACAVPPVARSRTQRNPKTSAIAAPTAATGQLTTMPTSRQTMPTAKPTGHRLGGGSCGLLVPRAFFQAVSPLLERGIQSLQVCRVNDVTVAATRATRRAVPRCGVVRVPYSSQRRRPARAPRRSSRSRAATRACPRPGPCASRRSRACRRRTAASARGRDGRAGPR